MKAQLSTAAILLAALVLYAAGADGGSAGFVITGALLELVLWWRLCPVAGRAPRRIDT